MRNISGEIEIQSGYKMRWREKALEKDPKNVKALYQKGVFREALNNYTKS